MSNIEGPNGSNDSLLGLSNKNSSLNQTSQSNTTQEQTNQPLQRMTTFSVKKQTAPTTNQFQQSSIIPNTEKSSEAPDQTKSTTLIPSHKKSKLWLIILIIIIIGLLGGGVYWYYKTQIISGKTVIAKYNKGSNLTAYKNDVSYFEYSNFLNALIYQKNDNIYGDFNTSEKNNFQILATYGGNLISLSPYNDFALIYYSDAPQINENDSQEVKTFKTALKDASGKYYLANLKTNLFESIGTGLNNFIWTPDNLFFLTNDNSELWTYDFRMANYTGLYDPSIKIFYKVTDLTYPIVDIKSVPNQNILFIISTPTNSDKSTLYSFNSSGKQFTKISDTSAVVIDFSPSGKYYTLADIAGTKISIYNYIDNTLVTDISETAFMPMELKWLSGETQFVYFRRGDEISELSLFNEERKRPQDITNYYDLVKFDLNTKSKTVLLKGKDKNIANPANISIDNINDVFYFSTFQTNNIYSVNIK